MDIAPSTSDPYLPSVSALLPMNGKAGSTTFTDVKGNVWTPAGGAQISTAHSFFGVGVGVFDGQARITTPDSAALRMATGDFSIECLVRFTAVGVNHVIVNKGVDTGNFAYQVWVNTSNQFGFRGAVVGGGSLDLNILGGAAAAGVDYFMSARRSGDVFTLHVNGSLIGTQTIGGARYADSGPLSVGAYSNGVAGLQGYLGQVRITPGVARPTAIPTEAWPLSGATAYALSGTVTGSTGSPVARAIRAQREDTGAYVGGTISNATTGAYTIPTEHPGEHTVVVYPVTGENLPALVHHGVIPI